LEEIRQGLTLQSSQGLGTGGEVGEGHGRKKVEGEEGYQVDLENFPNYSSVISSILNK
jgi:hypothetical protein